MAPKNVMKKKTPFNKNKVIKKPAKAISKPVVMDRNSDTDGDDDSDVSLDAMEFNSEYLLQHL